MGLDTPAAPSASADASSTIASGNVGGNTTTPARYRLKAFISHKGPSVHSGHYVAHIRVSPGSDADEGWVLFNDEKVVKADAASIRDLRRHAYLYIFERV
jgi:ubiquitin carboxyl-terminal hydrolase 5/13